MRSVWKHIHRLHGIHAIVGIQVLQVTSLSSRVTTHIDDTLRGSSENSFHDIRMHPCTGRVGDDDIRAPVFCNKIVRQYILHVTGIEQGVLDVVLLGVNLGILDGFRHIFDTDDLASLFRHEVGNGARTSI